MRPRLCPESSSRCRSISGSASDAIRARSKKVLKGWARPSRIIEREFDLSGRAACDHLRRTQVIYSPSLIRQTSRRDCPHPARSGEIRPLSLNFAPLIWNDAVTGPVKLGGRVALHRGEHSEGQHASIASELLRIHPPARGRIPEPDLIIPHQDGAAFVINQVFLNPFSRSLVGLPLLAPLVRSRLRVLLYELGREAAHAARVEELVGDRGERAAVERLAFDGLAPAQRPGRGAPTEFPSKPARAREQMLAVELGVVHREKPLARDATTSPAVMGDDGGGEMLPPLDRPIRIQQLRFVKLDHHFILGQRHKTCSCRKLQHHRKPEDRPRARPPATRHNARRCRAPCKAFPGDASCRALAPATHASAGSSIKSCAAGKNASAVPRSSRRRQPPASPHPCPLRRTLQLPAAASPAPSRAARSLCPAPK